MWIHVPADAEPGADPEFASDRITRIVTSDFPHYFAVITRIRQEIHAIGPDGGIINSNVVPQVQAIFPDGALTKKIKVGLQVSSPSQGCMGRLLSRFRKNKTADSASDVMAESADTDADQAPHPRTRVSLIELDEIPAASLKRKADSGQETDSHVSKKISEKANA